MKPRRGEPDRRRIALIPCSYLPLLGGVEEQTRNLARELVDRGNAVEIWTVRSDGLPHREVIEGITVHRLPAPLPSLNPVRGSRFALHGPRAMRAWLAAASAFGPDVMHIHRFGANGAYAAAVNARTRVPLVLSLHGETFIEDQEHFDGSFSMRYALRRAMRRASVVTGCSQAALSDGLAQFGRAAQRGVVVPDGIDLGEYPDHRIPPEPPEWQRGRYVLGLGRLTRSKGFDLLVDAFGEVAGKYPGLTLVLAGEGAEREPLRAAAERLGLARRVVLPGRLDRSAVGRAMSAAEVVVLPSRVEAFGIVVLEAWRAGTGVIASDRGGASELVRHAEDGLLVNPMSTVDLATSLDRLLAAPEYRQRLESAGRRRVSEFAWDRVVEGYERVYADVASIARILGDETVGLAGRR